MVKRKLREAEEEKIKVTESEDIASALDGLKESLINADKMTVTEEDEELTFSGAVEKIKEALEDLDIEEKEKVVEALEDMSEEDCVMTEEEIKDFVEEVEDLKEEIESLDKDEKKEVNESEEDKEPVSESEDEKKDEINEEEDKEKVEESDEDKESLEESVNRIFGSLSLNEETKLAVKTLIEAKIKEEEEELVKDMEAKCEEFKDELKKESEEKLAEEIEELNNKADSYLNHVAEEWAEENKLAIKEGLKVQIAENFMNGLRKLLKENDIEFDDEKEDLVQETVEKCEKLQDKLDEVLADKLELQEQVRTLTRYKLVQENTRELTQVQRERLSNLLEGVSYSSEAELLGKIKVLKENYIASAKSEPLNEEVDKKKSSTFSNDIDAYASFIARINK